MVDRIHAPKIDQYCVDQVLQHGEHGWVGASMHGALQQMGPAARGGGVHQQLRPPKQRSEMCWQPTMGTAERSLPLRSLQPFHLQRGGLSDSLVERFGGRPIGVAAPRQLPV